MPVRTAGHSPPSFIQDVASQKTSQAPHKQMLFPKSCSATVAGGSLCGDCSGRQNYTSTRNTRQHPRGHRGVSSAMRRCFLSHVPSDLSMTSTVAAPFAGSRLCYSVPFLPTFKLGEKKKKAWLFTPSSYLRSALLSRPAFGKKPQSVG